MSGISNSYFSPPSSPSRNDLIDNMPYRSGPLTNFSTPKKQITTQESIEKKGCSTESRREQLMSSTEAILRSLRWISTGENVEQASCVTQYELTNEDASLVVEKKVLRSGKDSVCIGYKSSPRKIDEVLKESASRERDWSGTYFADTLPQSCGYIDDYKDSAVVNFYSLNLRPYSTINILQCSGELLDSARITGDEKAKAIKSLYSQCANVPFSDSESLASILAKEDMIYVGPAAEGSDKEIMVPQRYPSLELESIRSFFVHPMNLFNYTLYGQLDPVRFTTRGGGDVAHDLSKHFEECFISSSRVSVTDFDTRDIIEAKA